FSGCRGGADQRSVRQDYELPDRHRGPSGYWTAARHSEREGAGMIDMRLTIDRNSGVPPFEQVRSSIAEQVNSGELPVGAKLPTVRALAADLGIAVNARAQAYRQLEPAGLLGTRGRAGRFVSRTGSEGHRRAAAAAAEYARTGQAVGTSRDPAWAIGEAALS